MGWRAKAVRLAKRTRLIGRCLASPPILGAYQLQRADVCVTAAVSGRIQASPIVGPILR